MGTFESVEPNLLVFDAGIAREYPPGLKPFTKRAFVIRFSFSSR